MSRSFLRLAAAATLVALALPVHAASDLDALKAAAAREGTLTLWHNTPKQETVEALRGLFNRRFGLDIRVARVPVSGAQMSARLMSEKRGGKVTVDVFITDDRHLPFLVENGFVEKIDWMALLGGPGGVDPELLRGAVEHVIPDYVGYGLEFRHDVYGIVLDKRRLAEDQMPQRWEDLATPAWRRKLAIDSGLSPLARLVPALGREATLDLARRIAANQPIYAEGQPAVMLKILAGEAQIGALSLSLGLEEQSKGAPLMLGFPEPQAVISQLLVHVAKQAPHPNLARLWAAWLASEGMTAAPLIAEGDVRAWPGAPGPFGAYYAAHHLTVRRAGSIAELEQANLIRKDLEAVVHAGR